MKNSLKCEKCGTVLKKACQRELWWCPECKEVARDERKFKDCAVVRVQSKFGWMCRLKILFTGRVVSKIKVYTENIIGDTKTEAVAWVPPLFSRRTKGVHLSYEVADRGNPPFPSI